MTTVLVVEDEALIAGDIQRTLVRLGYDVPTTAASGEKALDATSRLKPGLVLMDIKLRGNMDGIETALEMKSRFDVPIVYLTSHSDETTLARAKATNPHGYLLKPFSDRELRTAIEVALHRHELESRIAHRERWFSTTLRSIGDAVIATDENETVTFLNTVAEKLTGWGQEAVGRPLSEVFRVVDSAGAPIPSPIRLALEKSFAVELPPNTGLVVKSGERIAIDDSASPIIDDTGAVLGGVVIFRDITDRRELEARVVHTERLASLGTMAAGVAHEINNPLAYVIANIEMSLEGIQRALSTVERLADSGDNRARDRVVQQLADLLEGLRDAGDGAERVRGIVRDLRKFAGTGQPTKAALDIRSVVEMALKMTAHAVSHHARVRRSFGVAPPVEGNESALGQVFTNLILNAAQAIGDGHADENEIGVSTFTDAEGRAVIEITDTGPGIPGDVLPRLFDPFFTTKDVGTGMGLGLAICHNIIAEHGGVISAESPPGRGAVFRVTLPPAPPGKEHAAVVAPPVSSTARRGRILMIDDELPVATALARMLRAEHDVTVESDGRAAMTRILDGGPFDVIFCDLMMPNVSGVELYEAVVAKRPELAERFVFMTGGAFSARAQELLETVPNVQLAKPFAAATIRAVARDFVK